MRTLLLLSILFWAPSPDAGAKPGDEVAGNPQKQIDEALAALRPFVESYQANQTYRAEDLELIAEQSARISAALRNLPPTSDPEIAKQREVLGSLAATTNTGASAQVESMETMAVSVAMYLYGQGRYVQAHDGAAAVASSPTNPAVTPKPPATAPSGPSPGAQWLASAAGARAMAAAGQTMPKGLLGAADMGKARDAADRAKRSAKAFDERGPEALPGGTGGAAAGMSGDFARGGTANTSANANPADGKDLVLSAASGFKSSFDSLGLRAGRGRDGAPSVLHRDGTPASAEEIQALRNRIQSDPQALLRRPDFFSIIPRGSYAQLKDRYRADPANGNFKDMGLSEPAQRDFVWSASCAKVSAGCNEHAAEASYKKGDDVSPETLAAVWEQFKAAIANVEPELDEYDVPLSSRGVKKGATFASLRAALSGIFGDDGAAGPAVAVGASGPATADGAVEPRASARGSTARRAGPPLLAVFVAGKNGRRAVGLGIILALALLALAAKAYASRG